MKYFKIKLGVALVLSLLAFVASYLGIMSEQFTTILNTIISIIAV